MRSNRWSSRQARCREQRLHRGRLGFESLEQRHLLAVFTVTNLDDGPVNFAGDLPGSLRQAIFDANAAGGDDELGADLAGAGVGLGLDVRTEDHLHQAAGVAQIDEDDAAVVALFLDPAAEDDLLADVFGAHLAAAVGTAQQVSDGKTSVRKSS